MSILQYASIIHAEARNSLSSSIKLLGYLVLAHKFVQCVMRFVGGLLHGPEVRVIPLRYFDKVLKS